MNGPTVQPPPENERKKMENKKLIFERISAVMQEIGAVEKNRVNQQQRFNFRGIDDVYNAVQKIMAKHQVFTTVEIEPISRAEISSKQGTKGIWVHNRYHYTFYTIDGSSVITTTDGEAFDYGDKASNKAAAISHKYALIQTFAIPTKLDDPDDSSHDISATAPDKRHVARVERNLYENGCCRNLQEGPY